MVIDKKYNWPLESSYDRPPMDLCTVPLQYQRINRSLGSTPDAFDTLDLENL